jgi:hypothetical protein
MENLQTIQDEYILSKIYKIRNQKVMLDKDLAVLYGVTTGNLNKAVQRNLGRFPNDFMFQTTKEEFDNLMFQIGISSWGGTRKLPFCFTEHGVAMLSSVLNSDRAINVNINIIRIFSRMREYILSNHEILIKLGQIEKQLLSNSDDISTIFETLRYLINTPQPPAKRIGYRRKDEQT